MTVLDSISPLFAGTPQSESLSSFVQRLAAHHGTLPGPLVHRLLAWISAGNPRAVGQWSRRAGPVRLQSSMNGFALADHWIAVLSRADVWRGLERLTTRPWDRNFPTRGLLKQHLEWCSDCLRGDVVPYHRLVWLLGPVLGCPWHKTRLANTCPRCGRRIPVIHERSAVTACPLCAADLRDQTAPACPMSSDTFEAWTAGELSRIVAAANSGTIWDPAGSLQALCRRHGLKDAGDMARFLRISRITAWYWLTGAARPSLPSCLWAHFHFGESLAEALGCGPEAPGQSEMQQPIYLRPKRVARNHDWVRIRRLLIEAANDRPLEARSLLQIERATGVSRRLMRAHQPALCRRVGRRYRRRILLEAAMRRARLRRIIKQECAKLVGAGRPVTQKAIAEKLGVPGFFNGHAPREILRAFLRPGKAGSERSFLRRQVC